LPGTYPIIDSPFLRENPSGTRLLSLGVAIILLLLYGTSARAACLAGRVVGVTDGDTLTVLTPERQDIKVRLAGIDAPERGQPFGQHSKAALAELTFNKTVCVESQGTDRYERLLGLVFVEGLDVNAELLRRGMAWLYRRFSDDPGLLALEAKAKADRVGLWNDPQPQPPWEFRAGTPHVQVGAPLPAACGQKKYCREMVDCTEAVFYFRQCGVKRLDGDGDQIPCEQLCRGVM